MSAPWSTSLSSRLLLERTVAHRSSVPLYWNFSDETQHHQQLIKDIKGAILEGRLIAVCGVIGSGKTVTLRRLQQQLKEENRILVAKSLAVEKHSIKLNRST